MNCTVTAVRGLTVVQSVTWTGPDGNLIDEDSTTVGPAQTFGLTTNISLTLHYLQSSKGGRYYCKAAISILGMEAEVSAYKQLIVAST